MSFLKNFYFQQAIFASLHGLCVLLGLGPFDIWPSAFFAIFFILLAVHRQTGVTLGKVLISGMFFALALTLIPFAWILATIHRYTGESVTLTLVLGLCYALLFQIKVLFLFLIHRFFIRRSENSLAQGLALCALIALVDALSPELFTWSWGNALAGEGHLRQWASVGSVYLVSFIAGLGGWLLFRAFILEKSNAFSKRLRNIFPELGILLTLFAVGAALRYSAEQSTPDKLRTLIVQTNIGAAPEAKRGDAAFATEAVNRLFNQSIEGLLLHRDAHLIFWPEAAMPFHASEKNAANTRIYSGTFDGVLEYLSRISPATVVYQSMTYNEGKLYSQLASRPAGDAQYFKRRLVPWGEYLPLENIFPGIRNLFVEAGRFAAGSAGNEIVLRLREANDRPLNSAMLAADLPLLGEPEKIRARYTLTTGGRALIIKPLLCYEALFPSDSRRTGADLIVNLSSDAWFGDGIEGHQHAGAASLRAVENGIPMVRAAMSGVSFVIDNRGDTIGRATGQARAETLYTEIALQKRQTVFSYFGMTAFYLLMFAAAWPYLIIRFRFYRNGENK